MTKAETKELVDLAAKQAVKETMLTLGVNLECPRDVLEQQRDLQYLRDVRSMSDGIKKKGILATVSLFVVGVLTFLWLGAKETLLGQ